MVTKRKIIRAIIGVMTVSILFTGCGDKPREENVSADKWVEVKSTTYYGDEDFGDYRESPFVVDYYDYDENGRRTKAVHHYYSSNGPKTTSFETDSKGRVLKSISYDLNDNIFRTHEYKYDEVGNVLSFTQLLAESGDEYKYEYDNKIDDEGKIIEASVKTYERMESNYKYLHTTTVKYEYDQDGNMVHETEFDNESGNRIYKTIREYVAKDEWERYRGEHEEKYIDDENYEPGEENEYVD